MVAVYLDAVMVAGSQWPAWHSDLPVLPFYSAGTLGHTWQPKPLGSTPSDSWNVALSIKLADRRLARTILCRFEFMSRNLASIRLCTGDGARREIQNDQREQDSRHIKLPLNFRSR